nr:hypothetical protein [Tanacetum cinerariifolium]
MARLQFCDYHNMVAILEKGEFNSDFHPMVDFIAASPLRIETTDEGTHILATVDGIQRTMSESSLRRNLKLRDEDGILSIPDTKLFENLTLMGIVPLFDNMFVHQGEGSVTPTEPHHTPFPEADTSSHPTTSSIPLPSIPTAPIPPVTQPDTTPIRQYSRRARIAQSSVLPTIADEPASPVRDVSEREACPAESGFIADQDKETIAKSSTLPHDSAPRAQEKEIVKLKERVKVLEAKEDVPVKQSRDDALIKGRSINEGEAATERISNNSEEVARVLTSIDAATVRAGGIDVPTGSGFIPTAGPPATIISTSSEIARDAEVARIQAEEEIQGMIDSLDKTNETIAKYLQEYQDFASELPLEKRIELISGLVENFIPMGSKEETERLNRKGLNIEKEQVKKQKSLEEAPEIETSTEEFTEEKMKEMMQRSIKFRGGLLGIKCTRHSHCQVKSSHWQYKFPLLVKVVATARRLEMPLPEVCTAIKEKKKKLPVKDRWQLH